MSFVESEYFRIKNIIGLDKQNSPKGLGSVIKSEIMNVLVNYMDVKNIDFRVKLNNDNTYTIAVVVNTDSFYSIKSSVID